MPDSKKPRRSKPKTGADFFALEEKAWDELTATWRNLPDESLLHPGASGEWSIKDVINHIAAWQEVALLALPELLQGHKLPAGQYNIAKFNALHYAEDKDRTLTASRCRLSRSRRDLLAFLATVPETQMLDLKSPVGGWAKGATYEHYDEHLRDLQDYQSKG
jgi:uncharacterized damage-inducible protein DinB